MDIISSPFKKKDNPQFLPLKWNIFQRYLLDKGFKGKVVNRALRCFHGGSLEIRLTRAVSLCAFLVSETQLRNSRK